MNEDHIAIPERPIETLVRLTMLDEQTGIVRLYYREVQTGRILAKYALRRDGTWERQLEGEPETPEMILTLIF
jgi:hypothetical protein